MGAKVTPSAMEPTDFGLREVDVLIESPLGPFMMKVAVEAKDQGRPMDRKEFDSLKGKYTGEGRVAVDRVVIVTRSGFTPAVVELARKLRFELFTLDEAREVKWPALCPMPFCLQPDPKPGMIHIAPEIPADALRNGTVTCTHGTNHGKIHNFVKTAMFKQLAEARRGILYDIIAEAMKYGESCRKFAVVPDHPHTLQDGDQSYPIERVTFEIISRYEKATLVFRTMTLEQSGGPDRDVVVAEANFDTGSKQRWTMPDGFRSSKVILEANHHWLTGGTPLVFEMQRVGPESTVRDDGKLDPPAQWKSGPVTVNQSATPPAPSKATKKPAGKGKVG